MIAVERWSTPSPSMASRRVRRHAVEGAAGGLEGRAARVGEARPSRGCRRRPMPMATRVARPASAARSRAVRRTARRAAPRPGIGHVHLPAVAAKAGEAGVARRSRRRCSRAASASSGHRALRAPPARLLVEPTRSPVRTAAARPASVRGPSQVRKLDSAGIKLYRLIWGKQA